ncbi:MAG: hypothetical protein WAS56_10705 [Saprospiraceae bacterium]|nr:hypothetical protein [Saprospiraceae bacterium]MBK9992639.1 hypothetical protein [Saprospiraceae bacterium]
MKYTVFTILMFFYCFSAFANPRDTSVYKVKSQKESRFYFYWGYNRAFFALSDIHFKGPNYDFTLYDISAADRPSKFGAVYVKPSTITIPQYNYRLGYRLNNRWTISLGMDHMKYVIRNHQKSTISGYIDSLESKNYSGQYQNDTITIRNDFLQFEHTDGLNNISLDIEYSFLKIPLYKNSLRLNFIGSFGGLVVIPRTDVTLFGHRVNNKFHLSGYTFNAKLAPRIEWKSRLFLESTIRCGYMILPDILVNTSDAIRADQNISYLMYSLAVGVYF